MIFLVVPVGLLLLTAALIGIQHTLRKNVGLSWLIGVIGSTLVWGWSLYLNWAPDSSFQIGRSAFEAAEIPLLFTLDAISWPYLMALASLLLITMMTAPSRMDADISPIRWIGFSFITLIGFVAVTSGGVWPVIFCWMIFDILDFLFMLSTSGRSEFLRLLQTTIAIRLTGTILAAVGLAFTLRQPAETVSYAGGVMILVACGLRLGIIPVYQPYMELAEDQIGLATIQRLVSIVSVLSVLSRLPVSYLTPEIATALSLFSGFSALICSLSWVISENKGHRMSGFISAVASMAFASVLRGQQQASIVWGISLVMAGAPVFLYIVRSRRMSIFLTLNVIFFSGLPWLPGAAGWHGLIVYPFSGLDILFYIVQLNLLAGMMIHIHEPGSRVLNSLEPWMRTVYPFGFIMMAVSYLLIAWFGWDFFGQTGIPWASISAVVIAVLIWAGLSQLTFNKRYQNLLNWGKAGITLFMRGNRWLLNLNWFFALLGLFSGLLKKGVDFLSDIIESPGGILWEFILLTAFVLLILSGSGA